MLIKDRIIQVNEHCIKSLSNMEGAGYLRNSHQIVRLVLRRRRKSIKPLEVTVTKNAEEKSGALNGIEKKEIVTGTNDFKNGDDNGDSIDNGDDNSDSIDNGDDAIIDSDELIIEKWRAIMDNDGIIKVSICICICMHVVIIVVVVIVIIIVIIVYRLLILIELIVILVLGLQWRVYLYRMIQANEEEMIIYAI